MAAGPKFPGHGLFRKSAVAIRATAYYGLSVNLPIQDESRPTCVGWQGFRALRTAIAATRSKRAYRSSYRFAPAHFSPASSTVSSNLL
jgi:hypothetical protein